MTEGFELSTFHVPQQSRRDKLRETAAAAAAASQSGLLPLYDHTALLTSPSSILTCANLDTARHLVKEEGLNFMGFAAAASSSSSSPMFLDPCAQEDIPSTFFYPPQHVPHPQPMRDFCYPAPHAAFSYVPPAQGLSLSLSSSSSEYPNHSTAANQPTAGIFDHKGGGGGGGNCAAARGISIVGGMSRSSVPLGPFTGYAAVLKGSRFLEPARELLEEFCDVGRGGIAVPRSACAGAGSSAEEDREMESLSGAVIADGAAGISEDRRRKTRLVTLLNEVRMVQQYWSLLTHRDRWAPNRA